MRWVEVRPEPVTGALEARLERQSFVTALELLVTVAEEPVVVFDTTTRAGVLAHLLTSRNELGGLLLGRAFHPPQGAPETWHCLTSIEDFVPCRDPRSTGVSLAMEAQVWDEARARAASTGRTVVGWYHSHPNLGAFFSGTDRRTQRHFFNGRHSVGLVIDPLRGEEAWFVGAESLRLARPPQVRPRQAEGEVS